MGRLLRTAVGPVQPGPGARRRGFVRPASGWYPFRRSKSGRCFGRSGVSCRRSSCCPTKNGSGSAPRRAPRSGLPPSGGSTCSCRLRSRSRTISIGLRVRRATGLPWVAHFSDPWTDSPYLRGARWQQRLWKRLEADVVQDADALVFVNAQTAERVMRKYPDAWRRKAHVVPHGFDPRETLVPTPAATRRAADHRPYRPIL